MKTEPPLHSNSAAPTEDGAPLQQLLDIPQRKAPPARAEGIAIGYVETVDPVGLPSVSIPTLGLAGVVARSLVSIGAGHIGAQVALGFENSDPLRPLILGLMLDEKQPLTVRADGRVSVIEATQEIELRCGDASILLTADGQITLRGTYITSHASATQRIRGGSVQIN